MKSNCFWQKPIIKRFKEIKDKSMKKTIALLVITSLISCTKDNEKADAYGNFEAIEVTISAEANGKLLAFNIEEGNQLEANAAIGIIDTTQLYLSRLQLLASKKTITSKSANVLSQKDILQEQLETTLIEQKRIKNMFTENAATQRQVDEINGKVNVLRKQINSVATQNTPINNEAKSIDAQLAKIDDQIQKSYLINPIKGTVLAKYAEPNEITAFGKPLYKIADISEMTLRGYVSETQLPQLKIGQKVTVKIDYGNEMKNYPGTISWISSSAEFTPKVIQTKEERVNLVYAVKVNVKNDGSLKIGMPGEMWIN